MDASIAPGRILPSEAEDEPPDFNGGGWSPWGSVELCPVSGDASAMPAQQSFRGDDPTDSAGVGERGTDRSEQGPIIIVDSGSIDLATQNGELVA